MREILFKAKQFDTGEWIEGYLVQQKNNLGGIHTCIFQNFESENRWEMKRVDSNTVCQYTGLTDKNGKKIFEWDILKEDVEDAEETGTDRFIYSVLYSEEHSAFTTSDVIEGGFFEPLAEYINKNVEVIGNIFDNPELIGNQP